MVEIGRKKKTAKVVSNTRTSTESKGVRKRKNKAARKKRERERAELLSYIEEKRKRVIDSYNSLDLGVKDKEIIRFDVDLDIDGSDEEVISRIRGVKKMYKDAISVEICTRRSGYEDFWIVAEVARYETNYEYRMRKREEDFLRREKEIEEEAERVEKKNKLLETKEKLTSELSKINGKLKEVNSKIAKS